MKLFSFILLMILSVPAMAQVQTVPDPMRGLIWGVPQEAVKDFEKAEFIGEDQGVLAYRTTLRLGAARKRYNVMIEYRFEEWGLSRIVYSLRTNRGDSYEAVADAMVWQTWLDDAFAQTSRPQFSFQNPRTYDDPLRWGGAIYRGQGHINIDWRDEETRAHLDLSAYIGRPRINVTLSPAQSTRNP